MFMSYKYFYDLITMEKQAANRNSSIQLLDLVGETLFLVISTWICKFQKFLSGFLFFLSFPVDSFNSSIKSETKNPCFDSRSKQLSSRKKQEEVLLSREEAIMIMNELGTMCSQDSNEVQGFLSSNEFLRLFEEREPSLEEVKEAFHVFDYNKEGFIDARKLQRVLCILGFKEGSKLSDCEKMIERFDGNGDGIIDINEFVMFMERSF